MDSEMLWLRILLWSVTCCYAGRYMGKTVDIQYREPAGKPKLVKIPERYKHWFNFRYFNGASVVKEGLIAHILGYLFAALELGLLVAFLVFGNVVKCAKIADWVIIFYASFLCLIVLLPMSIKYERNLQIAYDRDWITQLQNSLTIYPKRKCRITAQIDSSTYEIVLTGCASKKRRVAKANVPVIVGEKMYAVHSYEQGPPFWTLNPC